MASRRGDEEPPAPGDPVAALLLEAIDRSYDRTSWHGPNLRSALRGVRARAASWRPAAGRRCVAEHALHAAYWKYVVRRRLRGDKRGSFPLKGSDWFDVDASLSDDAWRAHLELLDGEHRALREAVAALDLASLHLPPPGGRGGAATLSRRALVLGASAHDVYHAGQVRLLERLRSGG